MAKNTSTYVAKTNQLVKNIFRNGEEKQFLSCTTKGAFPSWLYGSIIRNGPGEFDIGQDTFKHWFDGHALIHKFDINSGQVTYSSSFVKSLDYKKNHECNRIVFSTFGTAVVPDPCKNIFSRFFAKFISRKPRSQNANVNITHLGNTYYAITDAPFGFSINPETLSTKEYFSLHDSHGMITTTAHPHFDLNGDYYNLGIHGGLYGFYGIYKLPASEMSTDDPLQHIQLIAKVPNNQPFKPCYFHSFALSENYITLHDQFVRFNVLKLAKTEITWDSPMKAFEHDPNQESVFHVVDKKTQVKLERKYCSKGRFCFHHVNSYEQTNADGKNFLIIDMLCADGPTFYFFYLRMVKRLDDLDTSKIPKTLPYRFVIPLSIDSSTSTDENLVNLNNCSATAKLQKDGSIFLTPECLLDEKFDLNKGIELPTINYQEYNTKPYNYMYSTGTTDSGMPHILHKINVQTKEVLTWSEENCYPSEPIFVKKPGSTDEDDGVVLSTVVNSIPENPIFLLVLDAKSFTELARAEVHANLPYPIHGCFTSKN